MPALGVLLSSPNTFSRSAATCSAPADWIGNTPTDMPDSQSTSNLDGAHVVFQLGAGTTRVITLRPLSTLTIALGRAYGSSTFFISVAEMNCSGMTRTSKPRAAGAVLGATVPASVVGGDDV